jgi:hypothetical protein
MLAGTESRNTHIMLFRRKPGSRKSDADG